MNTIAASDAKNKFGQLLEMAQSGPISIQKQGRDVAVLISAAEFRSLAEKAARSGENPLIEKLYAESRARWNEVYEALAK